jgi:hypothetical protein
MEGWVGSHFYLDMQYFLSHSDNFFSFIEPSATFIIASTTSSSEHSIINLFRF